MALVAAFAPPPLRGTRVVVKEVWADGAEVTRIVALVDAGHVHVRVARAFPLAEAARAHELLDRGGCAAGCS